MMTLCGKIEAIHGANKYGQDLKLYQFHHRLLIISSQLSAQKT